MKARSLVKDFHDVKVRWVLDRGKSEGTKPSELDSHSGSIGIHCGSFNRGERFVLHV